MPLEEDIIVDARVLVLLLQEIVARKVVEPETVLSVEVAQGVVVNGVVLLSLDEVDEVEVWLLMPLDDETIVVSTEVTPVPTDLLIVRELLFQYVVEDVVVIVGEEVTLVPEEKLMQLRSIVLVLFLEATEDDAVVVDAEITPVPGELLIMDVVLFQYVPVEEVVIASGVDVTPVPL